MVQGIDKKGFDFALMFSGLSDSTGWLKRELMTLVEGADGSESLPTDDRPLPTSTDRLRQIIAAHPASVLPPIARLTMLTDVKDVWLKGLWSQLEKLSVRHSFQATYKTSSTEEADDLFTTPSADEVSDIMTAGEDVSERMRAAIAASCFMPNGGEIDSPAGPKAIRRIMHALQGILVNIDEHPPLKLIALFSYAKLMSSNLRYGFGFSEIERGANTLYALARNEDALGYVREAAVAALGVLSETWVWRIPAAAETGELLPAVMEREERLSLRIAAMRAYGMLFTHSFIADPAPAASVLRTILAKREDAVVTKEAYRLLEAISSSGLSVADGDDDHGGSSSPPTGAPPVDSSDPQGTPPSGDISAMGARAALQGQTAFVTGLHGFMASRPVFAARR